MQTFPKKQLTIIFEKPILPRMRRLLDAEGVTGYTIFPALAGRGTQGAWDSEGTLGDTGKMVQMLCVLDGDACDRVLDHVFGLLGGQIGIVTVQDVQVIRPAHF
ncbi:MAG: transcriptional regulator [Rhizobiaceae bacterium]|jgi:nitrogen regulatory protein PII|nr:transcriptional regulator [Rhizobiaceae bacterium]